MADNISTGQIHGVKGKGKIVMLTAYDYPTAKFVDAAGVNIILVGDSLANTVLGYTDTKEISMNEMLHHCKAVSRAKPKALLVGDMPIHSYDSPGDAVLNAQRFLKAGCGAVKLEGHNKGIVAALVNEGIGVMGHVGLTPQTIGENKLQGKGEKEGEKIFNDAVSLEREGCFAIVIECVPNALGKKITQTVHCPTIGIGAGPDCDGQVLVLSDLLGLVPGEFKPKFVKRYADLGKEITRAAEKFKDDVKNRKYPGIEFSYG